MKPYSIHYKKHRLTIRVLYGFSKLLTDGTSYSIKCQNVSKIWVAKYPAVKNQAAKSCLKNILDTTHDLIKFGL